MSRRPFKVHEIIEQAIRENRFRERLLLGFACGFILLGTGVLLWGMIQDSWMAYVGVVESMLFVPAVMLVRAISHENTALRLLEIPLRNAIAAATMLVEFFGSVYRINGSRKQER